MTTIHPNCTAKFNMMCSNFGSHVQFDYASSRFNCTMCESNNQCPCNVQTPINSTSCQQVTNTPSCNCSSTDVSSSNITPMITSNCMYTTSVKNMDSGGDSTTTNMSEFTSSGPGQSTANSTCSCGPVAMDTLPATLHAGLPTLTD